VRHGTATHTTKDRFILIHYISRFMWKELLSL